MRKPLFKCEECKHSTSPIWEEPCYDCICHMGIHYDPIPRTNADRIRAMSDEELARWIADELIEPGYYEGDTCYKAWLKWLKEAPTNENTVIQK